MMPEAAQKVNQDASGRNYNNRFSQEYGSMLQKVEPVKIIREKGAKTAPENYGPLPTAPENAGRENHRGGSELTGEEKIQPTEYVIDRVVDNKTDGRCTLYRVSCMMVRVRSR